MLKAHQSVFNDTVKPLRPITFLSELLGLTCEFFNRAAEMRQKYVPVRSAGKR